MATINVYDTAQLSTLVIYDTATSFFGADNNTSVIANAPSVIQLDTIGATTTVQVQSRINIVAAWKVEASYTSADGVVVHTFAVKRNFVRLVRSSGTGAVKAYAQE